MDNILVMNTVCVPSYFNAGHHLPLFQVGQYIRENNKNVNVKCIDVGALNYTWKEIGDILFQGQFSMIAIMIDYDSVEGFERLLYYINELCPKSSVIIFGRQCKAAPRFFFQFSISAIGVEGDYECIVDGFWKYLRKEKESAAGCWVRKGDQWKMHKEGEYLKPADWVFPNLEEIPYDKYLYLYEKESNKFCGIPNRKELVINVSRGCPVGCKYCDVSSMQGRRERRLDPEVVCNYIFTNFEKYNFDYVSMYSAIFTLDKVWVEKFCELMIQSKKEIPWKCVTTIEHLSETMINLMGDAGCFRISIGVENLFENEKTDALPQIKQRTISKLERIVEWCAEKNIEVNCFVMVGIPGVSVNAMKQTVDMLKKMKTRIRPTIYTRYYEMNECFGKDNLFMYNRQLLHAKECKDESEKREIYNIIFGQEQ